MKGRHCSIKGRNVTKDDIHAMVEESGMGVVAIRRNRHWTVRVRRADGTEATVSFPVTPSDHRALLNRASSLKKTAKGVA
jgi:hypothetical protein